MLGSRHLCALLLSRLVPATVLAAPRPEPTPAPPVEVSRAPAPPARTDTAPTTTAPPPPQDVGGDRESKSPDATDRPIARTVVRLTDPAVPDQPLDESLETLAELDPRQAQVVELRIFGGLNHEEVAESLGVSLRTVEGDWRMAKAWLADRLGPTEGPGS